MSRIHTFLPVLALLAACAGHTTPVAAPTPTPTPPAVTGKTMEYAPSDTRWAEPGADYTAVFDGLIDIAGIAHLPAPSYPGHEFQVGVFDDAASWSEFARAAGIDPFGSIDWSHKVVVYAVLDAQTNMVGLDDLTIDGGVARMQLNWVQIPAHYDRVSPAVLVLLDRGTASDVRIAAGELPLGTVALGDGAGGDTTVATR